MFTLYFLEQSHPQWAEYSQCCQLADTTLADDALNWTIIFILTIFATLPFEYNNLLMALECNPNQSSAFFHPTNFYYYCFFLSGLLRGRSPSPVARPCRALQHLSKLFPVAVTHNSVSLLITVHLFWNSVSQKEKHTDRNWNPRCHFHHPALYLGQLP